MATDFYQRQDDARRTTKWLVTMFTLAVIGVTVGTAAAVWFAMLAANGASHATRSLVDDGSFRLPAAEEALPPLGAGAAALALIGGGSMFKVLQLRGGGHVVAEGLGARRVFPDTADHVERRLLNVVEEMALASGVPVPPVYMMDNEAAINAFAAGYSPSDAVIAVTRGTAEQLSRDELQGVVAHEFSHILNGDMRLNIRMIGLLFGILLVGLIGRIILRSLMHGSGRRSRSSKEGGGIILVMLLLGVATLVLGYVGTVIGNLLKAAVSRQREFLADASAVQFTRNPEGLAGALKRIGAPTVGSRLVAPNASEASHMYFATGVWEGFTNLTATHPPLAERIRRLDPQWDGKFPAASAHPASYAEAAEGAAGLVGGGVRDAAVVPLAVVKQAAEQVGDPTERHRQYAAALVEELPAQVRDAAREVYGARAVLLGLLTDRKPAVRDQQLATLQQLAPADLVNAVLKLLPALDALDVRARLPLVDLSLPALRAMSPSQYQQFLACFKAFVAADNRLGLFEWTLYRVLLRHLTPQFEKTAPPRAAYYGLQKLGEPCSVLLSTLAHADNRGGDARAAFSKGAERLQGISLELLPADRCGLDALSGALDVLSRVADKQRKGLVAACAATICADREVTVAEAELLRGVCDMLDCPMPPLLPGGPAGYPGRGAVA
jgi:Zn-dependent protease with chaperone function